jgi:hypothetical protein
VRVYITYDRYEHDEWLSIYTIETNKQRAIKKFKEEDLPSFLGYGPDDCHSFQLQKVEMSKSLYDNLLKWNGSSDKYDEENLKELLIAIFDEEEEFEVETLYSTDGSDNWDLLRFYASINGLDYDDDDVAEEIQEKLFNNDELYNEVLKKYIALNY